MQWSRLVIGCVLAAAVLGLCVQYGAETEADDTVPDTEDVATAYGSHVGETVHVSLVVRDDADPAFEGETTSAADPSGESNVTATGVLRGFESFGPVTVRGADRMADPGGLVQVRGRLAADRTVVAERVLVVNPYPWSEPYKYAVSVAGAALVLAVFFREWRLDRRTLSFEVRGDG